MYEDFLPLVAKPARYIDNEVNAVHKDFAKVRTKVCLFFPDTYEVGMSHIGLRILYHILNSREDTACERVFAPWTDYEQRLRAAGRPLTSLESNLPLSSFDIVGFTLQYELSYTNVLSGLRLAAIPVRSRDRGDSDPVVIAGGPCAVNPEPLADFMDVFFLGEAEEAVHEIVELRQQHRERENYLRALAERNGFYVPAHSKPSVRRRSLAHLPSAPYPGLPLLPLMKPVHDRVSVEVARGCIRGCRFCQAGVIYRPYRERSPEAVRALLDESLRCTGYEELSLASLSSGDYSEIQTLIPELMKRYRDSRVSISLPSLRVGTLTPDMVKAIAATRKTGFTLAPEAGTERLRRVINKPVSDRDLMDAAEAIFRNGWSVLKLYFMIGLPTETDEDLDGIIRLANDLLALGKGVSKRRVQLNVSVSTFVPKPHTPFQWFGQPPLGEIRRKQAYLEKGLRRRGIALKPHNPEMSLLEAAFARGDRNLGRVIEEAVNLGCRFDGWTECFDFSKWERAFSHYGLDPSAFACRSYDLEDGLAWDHIRSGVTKKFLKRESRRALAAEVTENCRVACEHCGIGCRDGGTPQLGRAAAPPAAPEEGGKTVLSAQRKRPAAGELTTRVRMKFNKSGRIRFLSHLDFMTLFHRCASRAGIPLAFSQGFNPHPKISFGPPLAVGMESEAEYVDLETDPLIDLLSVTKDLNAVLPEGVRILESRIIPKKAPSLSGGIGRYAYEIMVPAEHAADMERLVREFLARSAVIVMRDGREKDIRQGIESIVIGPANDAGRLDMILRDSEQVKPRPQDVIEQLFGISREQAALFSVRRVAMYCKDDRGWHSPMDIA